MRRVHPDAFVDPQRASDVLRVDAECGPVLAAGVQLPE